MRLWFLLLLRTAARGLLHHKDVCESSKRHGVDDTRVRGGGEQKRVEGAIISAHDENIRFSIGYGQSTTGHSTQHETKTKKRNLLRNILSNAEHGSLTCHVPCRMSYP